MSTSSDEGPRLLRQALRRAIRTAPARPRAALLEADDGAFFAAPEIEAPSLVFCAERVVMFQARMAGATRFRRLTIAGTDPSPCGACLQVLHEFAPHLEIRAQGDEAGAATLPELLPGAFGPSDLEPRARRGGRRA